MISIEMSNQQLDKTKIKNQMHSKNLIENYLILMVYLLTLLLMIYFILFFYSTFRKLQ